MEHNLDELYRTYDKHRLGCGECAIAERHENPLVQRCPSGKRLYDAWKQATLAAERSV